MTKESLLPVLSSFFLGLVLGMLIVGYFYRRLWLEWVQLKALLELKRQEAEYWQGWDQKNKNWLDQLIQWQQHWALQWQRFEDQLEQIQQQWSNQAQQVTHQWELRLTQGMNQWWQQYQNLISDWENRWQQVMQQFQSFQKWLEAQRLEGSKDQARLEQWLEQSQLSLSRFFQETQKALAVFKSDFRWQGAWGQWRLENLLQAAGLVEPWDVEWQKVLWDKDHHKWVPDAVIKLPNGGYLAIDAKVSFPAFNRYQEAESDTEKDKALKEFLKSVKQHVKDLVDRGYPSLFQGKSPDFVILFLPHDGMILLILKEDPDLWHWAWQQGVVLASPLNLLPILKTVAQLWRQWRQSENSGHIMQQASAIQDRLLQLWELWQKIHKLNHQWQETLSQVQKVWDAPNDGLWVTLRRWRQLGVQGRKPFPEG